MAVKDNKILTIGSPQQIAAYKRETTTIIDLKNRRVTPGFIDNHTHFAAVSGLLSAVQLTDSNSQKDFIECLQENPVDQSEAMSVGSSLIESTMGAGQKNGSAQSGSKPLMRLKV